MIRFKCAHCGKGLKAPPDKQGALARCPGCGQKTRIPAPAATAAEPAEPEIELVLVTDAEPSAAGPSPLRRVLRGVVSVVAIVVVLVGAVYGGMVWRAGGMANAPKNWKEFKARLLQEAQPDEAPAPDAAGAH